MAEDWKLVQKPDREYGRAAMRIAATQYGKFWYFSQDAIGQRISRGEFHDEFLRPYLDRLKLGDVFVDVGANIGFLSVYASKRGATVHAYEPSREVAQLLMQNAVENDCLRFKVVAKALYDKKCRLGINKKWMAVEHEDDIHYKDLPNSGGMSLVRNDAGEFFAEPLDAYNFPKISLLKVDTQGADLRVLVGAVETIKRCQPTILFEFEDGGRGRNASGDGLVDFEAFLHQLDYRMTKINTGEFGTDWVAEPMERVA